MMQRKDRPVDVVIFHSIVILSLRVLSVVGDQMIGNRQQQCSWEWWKWEMYCMPQM